MNILGIQLLGLILGLVFSYLTYSNIKKGKLKTTDGTFWMIIWMLLVVVSLNPNILSVIAVDLFKMSRTLDFIIVTSFIGMFGILYYMYLVVKNTEKRVERLVRNIAIEQPVKDLDTKKKLIKKQVKKANKSREN
jgi:hypothetical protein